MRRPSTRLETDEKCRKLDASTNHDGEVSRILQRSSMTAEHNETVNGLYSLLSPRSFKYALHRILREKNSKHCKPMTPSRFPQRNALRTPFLIPFLIYLKATLFCASCMIAHSAVFWPTDSLSFSITFVSCTCV
jgi:hypothetical protein